MKNYNIATYNYLKKIEGINFIFKLSILSGITISGFLLSAGKPAFAQSQSFSQCVLNLYKGPYSAKDAATNCLQAFQGKRVNEEFTDCVKSLYSGPYSQSDASSYCQLAFANSQKQNNNSKQQNSSVGNWVSNEMQRLQNENQRYEQQRQNSFNEMMDRQTQYVEKVRQQQQRDGGTNSSGGL